ncbi:hypothetical protein [Paenibacillus xylanexedens]|uniref:Suppressor of fused-like domain-containing protein n=1 Tax=Paenibacillus xylanexedens TaxID=528191 RepID=A0ABS4RLG7_PAEXY|nr:hypothetical protein [Paenibacillus xylanexedens]MBP2243738.1 hypothetical protein [Paenibacillus xylanexedens]
MQDWNEITMMNADALRKQMRMLAALDIIFSEEKWLRVHHYEAELQPGVAWGSINNGAGDHLHVLFTNSGTLIKGFDHESPLSPHAREDGEIYPGMYDEVPEVLMAVLRDQEETLDLEDVTFCLWQEGNDLPWKVGNWIQLAMAEEDKADARGGAEFLLGYLEKNPVDYVDWAKGYYDLPDLPLEAVAEVYEGKPVTVSLIKQLCPERDVAATLGELQQRGYAVEQT